MRTLIKNAQIVNEGTVFTGSVVIENERIAEILTDGQAPSQICQQEIDATGMWLLPGIIDDHVHFRDPGLTHKADMHTESMAAAAGGVTSIMDMPNTNPQTTTLEALEDKFADAAKKCVVNYSFYFGATNNNAHLLQHLDKKRVCGVKLFMGSSTGNMLVDQEEALLKIFNEAGMLIAVHCEDQQTIQKNTAHYKESVGEDPDVTYHPLIRNEEACYRSTQLAIQLAKQTGAQLHIMHISTEEELSLLENKPLTEKRITAEACIAHLKYSADDYKRLGTRIKCNPAIKQMRHRDALRKAITSNLIDVIGTDHAPHLLTEKNGGALKAVSGMPMIQFSLPVMLQLQQQGVVTMEQIVEKMCHAPATLYRIEHRGFIREGYYADLVLIKDENWTVTSDCILSKCGWSPLESEELPYKVITTFVNGEIVYNDSKVKETYRGKELRFDR